MGGTGQDSAVVYLVERETNDERNLSPSFSVALAFSLFVWSVCF